MVTGGCGFIGRNVTRSLIQAGYAVRILDAAAPGPDAAGDANVSHLTGSTGDRSDLKAAFKGVDFCVHLAGSAVYANPRVLPPSSSESIIEEAEILFEGAAAEGVPVVYASSAAVYGHVEEVPIRESVAPNPISAHGMEKLAFETVAARFAETHGLASLGLRMFNIYGPGQSLESPYCGVIRLFIENLSSQQPCRMIGDGTQVRDFVHVSDVAENIQRVIARPLHGADVVNVCSGRGISIKEIVSIMGTVAGRPLPVFNLPNSDGNVHYSVGDSAKGRETFGFRSDTSFEDAIRDLMEIRQRETVR